MEKLGLDALLVTDERTGRVVGLVDRQRILSRMVAALARGPRSS
jgi:hypothetical protein